MHATARCRAPRAAIKKGLKKKRKGRVRRLRREGKEKGEAGKSKGAKKDFRESD